MCAIESILSDLFLPLRLPGGKEPVSRAADLASYSALPSGAFSKTSHNSDPLLTPLPDAGCHRVSIGTGWPGTNTL